MKFLDFFRSSTHAQTLVDVFMKGSYYQLVRFKDRWEVVYPEIGGQQRVICSDNASDGSGFVLPIDIDGRIWEVSVGLRKAE